MVPRHSPSLSIKMVDPDSVSNRKSDEGSSIRGLAAIRLPILAAEEESHGGAEMYDTCLKIFELIRLRK